MTISTSPTTQDALSMIVQQYNYGKPSELQIDDVGYTFDAPVANSNLSFPTNTLLRAIPTPQNSSGYPRNIYYDRIDLSQIQQNPIAVKGSATYIVDLIPNINDFFGINLVPNDYYNDIIAQDEGNFLVRAKPSSLMFIGSLLITLQNGTPISVGEVIPDEPVDPFPGLGFAWEVGSDYNDKWNPNQSPTIRVSGVDPMDAVSFDVLWTPYTDGADKPPEFDSGYYSEPNGALEDRIYTLRLKIGLVENPLTLASGVAVIYLFIGGQTTNKSLVIVVEDGVNDIDAGFYEGVGTYATLEEAGLG